MAGAACAYQAVTGGGLFATSMARPGVQHAARVLKHSLHTPKAAAGKDGCVTGRAVRWQVRPWQARAA